MKLKYLFRVVLIRIQHAIFWIYHYSTSWVDRFDRFRWKYLKDYIDTYDICFKDW